MLVVLAALGLWLGFPNDLPAFPPAVFLWPTCVALLGLNSPDVKTAFKISWLACFIGSCAALYWLCFPVIDVGELHWAPGALCAAFICACLSLYGAVFGALAYHLRLSAPLPIACALAFSWYFLELSLSYFPAFPWLAISGALAAAPIFIQFADICGAYFTSALWLAAILAILLAFPEARGGAGKISRLPLCLGCALIIFLCAYGTYKIGEAPESAAEIDALFVEGNINQNQKWLPEFQRKSLDVYLDLTRRGVAAARNLGVEKPLIIWPETALPFFFERGGPLAREARKCAIDSACPLLFGAPGLGFSRDGREEAVYNRAFLLAPDGTVAGYYDKERLVPFGEYLPSWLDWPFLEALLQGVGVYEEGREIAPLKYETLALGILICYEGIFPRLAQRRVEQGANILVDISNDGWFRGSPASRQHLALTAPRCVEQNRWLLRGTNTGVSAVIDPRGRVVAAGGQFKAGWLLVRAGLSERTSFYHRAANWIPVVAFILLAASFYFARKTKGWGNN